MSSACETCLRRSYLIAFLAPRIAAQLERPRRRAAGVLALEEQDLIAAVAGQKAPEARAFLEAFEVEPVRRRLEATGIEAICRHAGAYPNRLAALADPPAALFTTAADRLVAGLAEAVVALVGTRRASAYGAEVARSLGRGLGAAGVAVVSGLALGIDAAAHRGCLEGGGLPIAVLAGGPDLPYPRTNRVLYEGVRDVGAVVSEMPPGQPPFRWSFPARNRIMAGLAEMTVVVEAAARSGSLITADFAQDLGRAVGGVPGRVTARRSDGSNALLRDGARVVLGVEDILEELFHAGAVERPPRSGGGSKGPSLADPELSAVLDALEAEDHVDGVVRRTRLSAARVRALLARLESMGYVRREGLGGFQRSA